MSRCCAPCMIVLALLGHASHARDPDPLTYADFGVYGRAVSPYYTSAESPFNLVLLQWNAIEVPDILKEQIRRTHEMGRKTILYCWFWKGKEKDGPDPVPTVEDCVGRIERMLGTINHDHVYGVSLGEENSPSRERAQLLHDLYNELKKRYPKMRFFQWYSAGLSGWPSFSPVPGLGAPLVGADGWIVDDYYVRGVNFKRMMWKYRMLDVPFVCIVWGSSGWEPSWKAQSAFDWADSQIDTLRRLNLAVGLFSVNQVQAPDGRLLGDLWAWEMDGLGPDAPRFAPEGVSVAPNPSRYYFNGDLYRGVGTDKRLYPPTRKKFDKYAAWASDAAEQAAPPDVNDPQLSFMARKMPLKVELAKEGEQNEGKFLYKDDLEGLIGRDGSGGGLLLRHADVDGALDLYYDGYADDGGFKVRGAQGREVRVTITYLIAGEQQLSNLKARVECSLIEKLGSDVTLSISLDGRHWTGGEAFRTRTAGDRWHGYILADAAQDAALKAENYYQAYVRIEMINKSEEDTDFATWLHKVEISVTKPD